MIKKRLLIIAGLFLFVLIAGGAYFWYACLAVKTVRYDSQLVVYWGGRSGNSMVLVSEDGSKALVVDTKMNRDAKKLRKSIAAKEVIVINTHSHADHTRGNALYPEAVVIAGAYSKEQWAFDSDRGRYPDQTLVPGSEKTIKIGSETIHIYNTGRAHSWNDVVVYCENRRLLAVGDLVFQGMHPGFIKKAGTHVEDWIKVLEMLPEKYNVKTVIPGHGKISDKGIIAEMKDCIIQIRNAVNDPD